VVWSGPDPQTWFYADRAIRMDVWSVADLERRLRDQTADLMDSYSFNKAWPRARIEAGCPDRIPHDFRRTGVRNLVRAGVPERGNAAYRPPDTSNLRTVQHQPGDLRDAAERLDTYSAGRHGLARYHQYNQSVAAALTIARLFVAHVCLTNLDR
jgi:hypothetical protein